jgi:hypothetical protein
MMIVPHRKHLWAFRASYGDSCTFIHVDYVLTSQETHLSTSRASYGEREYEEEREVGSSERHDGWGEQNISSVLKVPRHCPFVLLVIVSF